MKDADFNSNNLSAITPEEPITINKIHKNLNNSMSRDSLQQIDLLLLLIEAIEVNASQSMLLTSQKIGISKHLPNHVELWKIRCNNPLRKTPRRNTTTKEEIQSLILLISAMSDRLYPVLRKLLSKKEPEVENQKRWNALNDKFTNLISERMNIKRAPIRKVIRQGDNFSFSRQLVLTLALASGPSGAIRLGASMSDYR